MAVFVVWERNKIIEVGYQVAKLQRHCDELSETNRKLNYHVGRLKTPENVAYKVQSLKLPLVLQEDSSGIMVAGRIKVKKSVTKTMKTMKTNLKKDLYTQKGMAVDCCSLHY